MPPIVNNDVRLPLGMLVDATKHASNGGNPYPPEIGQEVIAMWQNGGMAALQTNKLQELWQQKKFPHLTTCKSQIILNNTYGYVLPKRPTGNKHLRREVHGQDLFNLLLSD